MAEYKAGDRVRVVIEGTVEETAMDSLRLRGWRYFVSEDSPGVVTIEKLRDPLPTTPGSVIRLRRRRPVHRMLHEDGQWHAQQPGESPLSSNELHEPAWDVVYDAGKQS